MSIFSSNPDSVLYVPTRPTGFDFRRGLIRGSVFVLNTNTTNQIHNFCIFLSISLTLLFLTRTDTFSRAIFLILAIVINLECLSTSFADNICPNATALDDAVRNYAPCKILCLPLTSGWVRRLPLKHCLFLEHLYILFRIAPVLADSYIDSRRNTTI